MVHKIIIIFILLSFSFFACSDTESRHKSSKQTSPLKEKQYKKAYELKKAYKFDSAYYHFNSVLKKFYKKLDSVGISATYFSLATIDYYHNDLISCEDNCVKSLEFISTPKETKYAIYVYNLLGLVSKSKGAYKDAIYYFEKCPLIYRKIEKDTLKSFVIFQNNMGKVYLEAKKYSKSIDYYNNIIQVDSVRTQFPKRYARALGNKAWNLFKNNKKNQVYQLLNQAIRIRKKENDHAGLAINYLRFSKYYFDKKQLTKAKESALKTLAIANHLNIPNNKLEALLLLAKSDKNNAISYFTQYKQLQDSIINKERFFKDQTAKIRYETKQKEEKLIQQKQLLEKRKKSLLWGAFFFVLVIALAFLFLFQKTKIKNQNKILDITNVKMSKQNELLAIKNTNIQTLQRELHHRVKNNFSIIDSLLDEFKEKANNPVLHKKFTELQNRINSMYEIHVLLYKNVTYTNELFVKQYLDKLCKNVQESFLNKKITIRNNTDENLSLAVDKTFPVGLIINEFLTNSFKYAFNPNEEGHIEIKLQKQLNNYLLTMSDNGKGLPENFSIQNLDSFGMDVMQLLTKQLGGDYLFTTKKGVSLRVQFPVN